MDMELEDFTEDMDTLRKNALGRVLYFLREKRRMKAGRIVTQIVRHMVEKRLKQGKTRASIAEELGITERRVYQIQKNMK